MSAEDAKAWAESVLRKASERRVDDAIQLLTDELKGMKKRIKTLESRPSIPSDAFQTQGKSNIPDHFKKSLERSTYTLVHREEWISLNREVGELRERERQLRMWVERGCRL